MREVRLDPRTRMLLLVICIAGVLATRRLEVLALEAAVLLAAAAIRGPERSPVHLVRPFAGMLLLVGGIGWVFFDGRTALELVLRLFDLLAVASLFFRALDPEDVSAGLQKFGVPFRTTFVLTAALRYVPLIRRRAAGIRDAQQARGIDLRPRIGNLPALAALLVPLVVQAFVLADQLALAMESRGFGRRDRSLGRDLRMGAGQVLLVLAAGAAVLALAWWERG